MITTICLALNCCILTYGGYTDYKRREIPNLVPILLMVTGFLSAPYLILYRFLGLVVMAGAFLLGAKLTNGETPGGDFKLLCALAFSEGIVITLFVLLLAGIGAAVGSMVKKKAIRRNIPLCTYVAPAFLLLAFLRFFVQ